MMETATQEQLAGAHESFHKQNGNGHILMETNGTMIESISSREDAKKENIEEEKNKNEDVEEKIEEVDKEEDSSKREAVKEVYKNSEQSALDVEQTKPKVEQSNDVIVNNDNSAVVHKDVIQETNDIERNVPSEGYAESDANSDKEVSDGSVKTELESNIDKQDSKETFEKLEEDGKIEVESFNSDPVVITNATESTNSLPVANDHDTIPNTNELPESDMALVTSTNEINADQVQNKAEGEQKHTESGSESDQKSEPECDIGHKVSEVSKVTPSSSTAPSPAIVLNKDCDIFNFKSGSIKKKDLVPDKVPWNENEIKPIIEATYKMTTWDDIWESKMKAQPLKPLDIELPKPRVNKSVDPATKHTSPKILKDTSKPADPNVTKVVKTTRFKITPHVEIPTVDEEEEPSPPRENSEEGSSEHLLPPDAPRIESNLNELTMVESQLKKLGVAAEEMVLKKQLKSLRVDMEDDVDEIILQRRDSNRHTMTVSPGTKFSKKPLTRRNSNTESDGSSGGIAKRLGWLNIFKKRPSTTPPPQTPPPEKEKVAAGPIPKTTTTSAKRLAQPPLLAQLNPRVLVIPEVSNVMTTERDSGRGMFCRHDYMRSSYIQIQYTTNIVKIVHASVLRYYIA